MKFKYCIHERLYAHKTSSPTLCKEHKIGNICVVINLNVNENMESTDFEYITIGI